VQLEGKRVELHLVDLFGHFGSSDDNLEGEALSESVSLRSTEAHVDGMLSSRGREVGVYSHGDGELEGLVARNVEGDINSDGLNGHVGLFISVLGIIHTEEASLLPGPLSSVLDLNLSEGSLSREDSHDSSVVLVDGLGTFVFPLTTAFAPVFVGTTHHSHELLAHSHHVLGFAFGSFVSHKLFHHIGGVESVLFALSLHLGTHLRVHELTHHFHGVEGRLLFRFLLFGGLLLLFLLLSLVVLAVSSHFLTTFGGHELFHHLAHHASAFAISHRLFPVFALLDPFGHLVELFLDLLDGHIVTSFLGHLMNFLSGDVLLVDELLEELHVSHGTVVGTSRFPVVLDVLTVSLLLHEFEFGLESVEGKFGSSSDRHGVELLGSHALGFHEFVHNHHPLLVVTVTSMVTPTTGTSTAASPRTLTVSTRLVLSVVVVLRRSLVLLLSFSGKNGNHHTRDFLRVSDLEEGVRVLDSLLADGAEVEVF